MLNIADRSSKIRTENWLFVIATEIINDLDKNWFGIDSEKNGSRKTGDSERTFSKRFAAKGIEKWQKLEGEVEDQENILLF